MLSKNLIKSSRGASPSSEFFIRLCLIVFKGLLPACYVYNKEAAEGVCAFFLIGLCTYGRGYDIFLLEVLLPALLWEINPVGLESSTTVFEVLFVNSCLISTTYSFL